MGIEIRCGMKTYTNIGLGYVNEWFAHENEGWSSQHVLV